MSVEEKKDGWAVIDEFLAAIYGPKNKAQVWVTGFADIDQGASWFGMQGIDALRARLADVDQADLYFCTGLLRDGANNRTLGEVVAQPLLYADDIGTKVDPGKWDAMFAMGFPEPTFRIETSPGNETWGWKLTGDATTPERWTELALIRAYMIERGLTDALHDATRYLRLPWGHNSKPKYKDSKNRAPAVGYTEWHADRESDIDVIGQVLIGGAKWRDAEVPMSAKTSKELAALGAGARPRDADLDVPVIKMAEVVGLEPKERTAGVVDALCPNWHNHGDRAETGFSFIGSDGACFCNHASCQSMRTPDFLGMIRSQYEDHVSALNAVGKNDEGLPPSASAFEAGRAFGTDDETSRRMVEEEANALASRNQRRAEKQEEQLAMLAQRFVWVKGAEAFYDTTERVFYSPAGIARHESVTQIIPAGSTGQKAAANVLANHPSRIVAAGLAYVPGALETLVEVETESGFHAPHINTWVPSQIDPVEGNPDLWLRTVEHVLHDKTYREWFLDWLAWIIQHPAGRTPVIPLLISGQGAGKDTLLRPIQQLLGAHNCTSITTGQITGNFNEFLRKRLLLLQEVKFDAGGAAYNRVKDWTGSATGWVEINEKHRRPYSVRFCGVFIGLTNDEAAVKGIDHDDRRFAPFISYASRLDDVFTPTDHAALDAPDEVGCVLRFLQTRNLANFNSHVAPDDTSGSKARIIAAGMPIAARTAYELVANGRFAERHLVAFDEVMTAVQSGNSRNAANTVTWGNIKQGLLAAGWTHVRPRGADQIKVDGRNTRLWVGPKAPAWMRDLRAQSGTPPRKFAEAYQADLDKAAQELSKVFPDAA